MIYTDHWAFQHIPKNGGTNFRDRVPQHMVRGQSENPAGMTRFFWHQPISYHLEYIPHLKNLQWICIVRHPEDRLASWYYFMKKLHPPRWHTIFSGDISFEEFVVENRIKILNRLLTEIGHAYSFGEQFWKVEDLQSNWFNVPDGVNLKHFRLEDQLDELESYVGFKFSDTKYNSSDSNPYYTDEMKRITYIQYQRDYENFGYEMR
jgi:hypothetical protein